MLVRLFSAARYVYLTGHLMFWMSIVIAASLVEVLTDIPQTTLVIVGAVIIACYWTLQPLWIALMKRLMGPRPVRPRTHHLHPRARRRVRIEGAAPGRRAAARLGEAQAPEAISFSRNRHHQRIWTAWPVTGTAKVGPRWRQRRGSSSWLARSGR
ncbi:PTS transporter subunit IIC [Georgenia sp. SUBG003]|uniref:PTS transporter subunit IIC n=1 Tax=Georgenia sp. SUBG003 TaxID=1497974 RepID=UPI003AB6A828